NAIAACARTAPTKTSDGQPRASGGIPAAEKGRVMVESVDSINMRTMTDASVVAHYARPWGLSPTEQACFARIADEARGRPILDIGVGGGRTVEALRNISDDYTGIDYSADMVAACRHRFPGVRFEHADARALAQ